MLSSPLNVTVLPKSFATVSCGICCISGALPNHIIDLDNADVFELRLTFETIRFVAQPTLARIGDPSARSIWDALTQICARVISPDHSAHLLNMVCQVRDAPTITRIFRSLFHYWQPLLLEPAPMHAKLSRRATLTLPIRENRDLVAVAHAKRIPPEMLDRLHDLEQDTPRADGLAWQAWFARVVKNLVRRKEYKTYELASAYVFERIEQQLQHVRMLRQALDAWTKGFAPDLFMQLVIGVALQSETILGRYPAVPCLTLEIETAAAEFASGAIRHRLAGARVALRGAAAPEAQYWLARMAACVDDFSGTDSGSASLRSLTRTRSVDSSESFQMSPESPA